MHVGWHYRHGEGKLGLQQEGGLLHADFLLQDNGIVLAQPFYRLLDGIGSLAQLLGEAADVFFEQLQFGGRLIFIADEMARGGREVVGIVA